MSRRGSKHTYVDEIYHVFRTACRQLFDFLERDYGFALVGARDLGALGISATYKNATTGVKVSLEPREKAVFVYIIKLSNGEIPQYLNSPSNWLLLECLLSIRSPSSKLPPSGEWLTPSDVGSRLSAYAAALESNATDMLRGDFSALPEVQRICRERAAAAKPLGPAVPPSA